MPDSIEKIVFLVVWYLVFLISTTCHEAAHALVAKWGGDFTAYKGGQVSLDPMPHIRREPFGMVLFPIISLIIYNYPMGWASAPYDLMWAREHHRRAALMALAGPMANFILMIISGLGIKFAISQGFISRSEFVQTINLISVDNTMWIKILGMTFFINCLLFVLNLIPLPSFDGGNVITFFMNKNQALKVMDFMMNPAFSLIGFFVIFQFFGYIFWPFYILSLGFILS